MQSKFTRLVFVFILYNYLIINETVVLFRYAVFTRKVLFLATNVYEFRCAHSHVSFGLTKSL